MILESALLVRLCTDSRRDAVRASSWASAETNHCMGLLDSGGLHVCVSSPGKFNGGALPPVQPEGPLCIRQWCCRPAVGCRPTVLLFAGLGRPHLSEQGGEHGILLLRVVEFRRYAGHSSD